MKDNLHPSTSLLSHREIRQIPFHKLHRLKAYKILPLTGSKVVHPTHRLTPLQQRRRNRPPNKPRRPSHQIPSQNPSLISAIAIRQAR